MVLRRKMPKDQNHNSSILGVEIAPWLRESGSREAISIPQHTTGFMGVARNVFLFFSPDSLIELTDGPCQVVFLGWRLRMRGVVMKCEALPVVM